MNKNYVYRCFRWLANGLIKQMFEKKLPNETVDLLNKFYSLIDNRIEDFWEFDEKLMLDLGFIQYESSYYDIWLIPIWMFPLIPEDIKLYATDGSSFEFHSEIAPKTTLFNCFTYGLRKVHQNSVKTSCISDV